MASAQAGGAQGAAARGADARGGAAAVAAGRAGGAPSAVVQAQAALRSAREMQSIADEGTRPENLESLQATWQAAAANAQLAAVTAQTYLVRIDTKLRRLENLVEGKVVNHIEVPEHEAKLAKLALDRMLAIS